MYHEFCSRITDAIYRDLWAGIVLIGLDKAIPNLSKAKNVINEDIETKNSIVLNKETCSFITF